MPVFTDVLRIPGFALAGRAAPTGGVPVFVLRGSGQDRLVPCLGRLRAAGYASLAAHDVAAIARGEAPAPERAVALSFVLDAGPPAVGRPLARLVDEIRIPFRAHGMRAIAFVSARWIAELDSVVGEGPAALADAAELDVQCRSEARVFTGERILDFQHPRADGRPRYPWLWSALDARPDEPLWGAPVYPSAPRLVARRFHDDPELRAACLRFVAIRGGRGFLADVTWRDELTRFVRRERRRFGRGRWEDPSTTRAARVQSLAGERSALSDRLGRTVDHVALALPGPSLVGLQDLLSEAGFRSAYCGRQASFLVRPGIDPFRLGLLDGRWAARLPGPGRAGLLETLFGGPCS